jgi:3-phenylpropionate/trans-cinnamate dioxygenase ferredoxin reductase subunit
VVTLADIVIVGGGLAGASAAQALREERFDGRITIVGDEAHRPYERPPLSKEYLQGRSELEKVFVHPPGWYAEHDVDLLLGTSAVAIDLTAHSVTCSDGRRLGYDRLLLATGSSPRRLAVPGHDLDGVHYLRRIDDAQRLREGFARSGRVVVIGAGWIGLETAAAARMAGLDVTLLEVAALPLLGVLGPEVATAFADLHRSHGVDLRCGVSVAEIVGQDGRATGVRLDDGEVADGDLVVVGVGITPNDALARDAGLEVANGITVDAHLRSSDPDVFAAGDVASAFHPRLGQHVRVEHWANARRQGNVAARGMLDRPKDYDRLPYFFSDQYDMGMEYTGHVGAGGSERVVLRGDPATGAYLVFWLAEGRVLAGMAVNTWDVMPAIEDLILTEHRVDVGRLTDPAVPLAGL